MLMKKCGGTVLLEQWNSDGRTVRGNSGRVVVEQWNSDGGTLWWNSGTVLVKHS